MRALSIRQPWASLIIFAGKNIENREWKTGYRGPILIHASKRMTKAEKENAFDCAEFDCDVSPEVLAAMPMERGAVIGIATITDCVTQHQSPWFCGTYGFVLRDVRAIEPFQFLGQLGFFDIPYKLESEL
jgi:hypothetical protein